MRKHYICLISGLLLPAFAHAQIHVSKSDSSMTKRVYNLNPVVVTGTGHHQRLKTTATPVHVISKQEIKEKGISTFQDAITRMMPQVSVAPNSMGTFLRLNGLGNKHVLILLNGKKLNGDLSNNVDFNRINMESVKRIEVLDGAASSLYGSDAIGGVINIITDQPTDEILSLSTATRVSGKGQFTQSGSIDIYSEGFGSYTTFSHDEANSYSNNDFEYVKGSDTETQKTIAPLYNGYVSNVFGQKFTYNPNEHLALRAEANVSYRRTDRPEINPDITGGYDYEMRFKSLRWGLGGIYKFNDRNSLHLDFLTDKYRYGKEYDMETKNNHIGDYIQSKKQKTYEAEAKGIFGLTPNSVTIIGADWRNDFLKSQAGSVNSHVYTIAGYAQHELMLFRDFKATAGVRYTYHKTFKNHFTPKLAVMYSPGNFNFRATYSSGFRAPGLDELYYHYFGTSRGKAQITFGNKNLKPENSNYFSLNAEYHTDLLLISVTGYVNFIKDMVIKNAVSVTDANRDMLAEEFPEMTSEQLAKLDRYTLYTNSDKGEVKGLQVNVSANIFRGFNLNANYAYTYARTKTGDTWSALERSIKNVVTLSANYYQKWRKYALNINVNGRLQGKTYYPEYENAPGFGLWNINTVHTIDCSKWLLIEPSIGVDNIFDKVDNRIDSVKRRYALFSPGRMLVVGLRLKLK